MHTRFSCDTKLLGLSILDKFLHSFSFSYSRITYNCNYCDFAQPKARASTVTHLLRHHAIRLKSLFYNCPFCLEVCSLKLNFSITSTMSSISLSNRLKTLTFLPVCSVVLAFRRIIRSYAVFGIIYGFIINVTGGNYQVYYHIIM